MRQKGIKFHLIGGLTYSNNIIIDLRLISTIMVFKYSKSVSSTHVMTHSTYTFLVQFLNF